MQAFFGVAYFLMGIVQFFAIWDFLSGGDGGFLSFIGAISLAGIPIVGSALGVLGAYNVWGWSLMASILLMFGWLIFFGVFALFTTMTSND
jgi:hypothetical protein